MFLDDFIVFVSLESLGPSEFPCLFLLVKCSSLFFLEVSLKGRKMDDRTGTNWSNLKEKKQKKIKIVSSKSCGP